MSQLINVNNVKGNFYGGLPYNISWDFNGGETPSRLKVSVVNEKGNYFTPNVNLSLLQPITFGQFKFNGYLVGYSFNNTPNQKTLDLEYIDKSIDLNKYYVALNYKQVPIDANIPGLIKVGKDYHPCDQNMDSTLDYKERFERQIDYCDPCPYMPEDKYDYACDPVRSNFEIFEVYYTFNELIANLPRGFNVDINASKYTNYKAQHFGTLPSVLSSWCSDLGLSYHWDPFNNKLIFLDRSKPISIPSTPNNIEIIDTTIGKSLENSFSRGFIGTFEKQGEIKKYNCTKETFENVKCLVIDDLYEEREDEKENKKIHKEADIKELAIAVSYLGVEARKAFLWFWYYGVYKASDLYNKYLYTEGTGRGEDQSSKVIMPHFGDMKILDVWWAGGDDSQKASFIKCKKELSDLDLKYFKAEDKKNKREDTNPSYYFFVAESNEELADKLSDTDVNMARSFLGRYWFKKFKVPIPGANNSNSQVQAESPEGSASWHAVDDDVTSLPIFGFGHEENSRIGTLLKDIEEDKKKNEQAKDAARQAAQDFLQSQKTLKNTISFLLLDRETKWWPNEDYLKWYESLFKWYKDISPMIFGNQNGRPDFLSKIYPDAKKNSNIKLFIARELDKDFKVEFKKEPHPLEPNFKKQKTKEEEDVFGRTQIINQGTWGLRDNKCVRISMPGIEFFTPTQCFGNNDLVEEKQEPAENAFDPDIQYGTDDGDEGFRIFCTSQAEFTKVIPKIQYHYIIPTNPYNVASSDYQVKQITEDNLSVLNDKKCIIPKKSFEKYAKKISEFTSYTQDKLQSKLSFKVAGIAPLMYSTSQGLTSVQITLNDEGVFTSYNLEDKIIQPPSDSYIDQYLKDSLLPKKSLGYLGNFSESQRNQMRSFKSAY